LATSLGTVEELLAFYDERGYRHRIGPGIRPAIVVIDFSLAFTGGYAEFPGRNFTSELAATRRLLEAARTPGTDAARSHRVPVFYTTISYAPHLRDAGYWVVKVPWLGHCLDGTELVRIDPSLDPRPEERTIVKKYPSCFFGTGFDEMLKADRIDTLIIAGCTTSVCVRATALDAMQYGYRAIVAAEAVGDFTPALHALHLKDIGSRYADVMVTDDVVRYLHDPAGSAAAR
jgi:nicotinamidase-related amidase